MMVKADECFSGPLFRPVAGSGFDVLRSMDLIPGAQDQDVLALSYRQGRILLTEDMDFGELTVRMGLPTLGVVRVALMPMDKALRADRLIACLLDLGDQIVNALVTIEPTRARVRRLQTIT